MVVTAKSPQQQAQSNQTAQVIRPGATTKQVMKQQNPTQNVVIKNKQQPVTTSNSSIPTTTVGQTGQTVRKIIRHDSTSSDSNQTVQGQQAMKSALTTSPRPQTVLSPATQQQQQATPVVDYQRQAVPAMPIRAQMIGPQMAKGGLIYYAAPNGLTAASPGGSFLPYTQPIPLRTVHDNNNAFPKIATQGSTAYVHMIGNQPIVSQASNQQPQYVPTSQTIQMITSTQQSSSPDMFTIKPSILNRKRPQAPVVVQQSTPPPPVSTNTTATTTRDSSNPPSSKQAKLETPSTSSSPGLDQPVNIKVASKLKYEHTVIRSPQRNRRKQILDTASPLRTASPARSTSTIAPDKAVDDVSTDDADEWENEHPKEMKLSFEESPVAAVQSPTATPTTHTALPRYRKFQKDSNNQRRASLNQSNSTPNTTTTPIEPAKEPKLVARAHRTRQPSKIQKTQVPPQTPKVKSHRAQMGWEKRESSSLHFMCDDHVSRLCGEVLDERPLRNRELKEQARCCIFKLNLLNRELAKCQTDHKVLQTRFSHQKSKARVLNYLNSNVQ